MEPGEAEFSETTLIELDDDVFTCVGGSSLFLELGLDFEEEELASTMLTHQFHGIASFASSDNMVVFPLHKMIHLNYSEYSLYCPAMELTKAHSFARKWDKCTVGLFSLQLDSNSTTLIFPWDPGIVTIRKAFSLFVSRLDNLGAGWSCMMLNHEYAIAWGQAMFFGGGIVTPGTLDEEDLDVMGHGPSSHGLAVPVEANKRRSCTMRQGIEQK